jgi:hypothetical protein
MATHLSVQPGNCHIFWADILWLYLSDEYPYDPCGLVEQKSKYSKIGRPQMVKKWLFYLDISIG